MVVRLVALREHLRRLGAKDASQDSPTAQADELHGWLWVRQPRGETRRPTASQLRPLATADHSQHVVGYVYAFAR